MLAGFKQMAVAVVVFITGASCEFCTVENRRESCVAVAPICLYSEAGAANDLGLVVPLMLAVPPPVCLPVA